MKVQYKQITGQDWKPQGEAKADVKQAPASKSSTDEIDSKIRKQGDIIRELKSKKVSKAELDVPVKALLLLKEEYKKLTGQEWKPQGEVKVVIKQTEQATPSSSQEIDTKIREQGNIVRDLKSKKASKAEVDVQIKALLLLKEEYKKLTGQEWKPDQKPTTTTTSSSSSVGSADQLNAKIIEQGEKIRALKSNKADKATIDPEVKILLDLKSQYKTLTGSDWKPETTQVASKKDNKNNKENMASLDNGLVLEITEKIKVQGDLVRDLKTKKAAKDEVDGAVKVLLDLKAEYKKVTGTDFPAPGKTTKDQSSNKKPEKAKKSDDKAKNAAQQSTAVQNNAGTGAKKQTRLGLEATKEDNLPEWYSQVITKGELIEYYDVSGCYILRPWSFAIWKYIKNWFDAEITKLGVKECYFPMFVAKSALEKEKTHVADFSPEVAWVTKSGDSDLAEPIAIRPTSETVMYPAYAKWVQSYRDLPIRLNQWNNVVRWEFKHPQPFLRTREFLWQEGHTAFATLKEAEEEVLQILDLYRTVYEELLAIPVIKGRKTEKEKFAGGYYTTTVEAYISASGRAIQGATSHCLGQNFSKMFEITFKRPDNQETEYVYQNSWGITTRSIGVMIMVHADNKGLVLPPRVACIQVVIIPCGITANSTDEERDKLVQNCKDLEKELLSGGVRCEGDYRDNYTPAWRYNHWELKGVPIRIELGPKDVQLNQVVAVRRDTGEKINIPKKDVNTKIPKLLEEIQQNLFNKATIDLTSHLKTTKNWNEFLKFLDEKNIIMAPFCGEINCEDTIKKESAKEDPGAEPGALAMGAKTLCIPFKQPTTIASNDKCLHPACNAKPMAYVLFGRSY